MRKEIFIKTEGDAVPERGNRRQCIGSERSRKWK